MGKKVIEVKTKNGTNETLQKAVDTAYRTGVSSVIIGPGVFEMYDSLHLRSGVKIFGTRGETILRKHRCISSGLSADLGYGYYDVSVRKPQLFKVGMGVYITDDAGKGFYGTVATIMWKNGDKLGINRMLNHDYARVRNARVSTVFPVISGYYVRDASIQDISIDGNAGENIFIDGCRGGGIFLLQCHGINLLNISVRNYNGDGISFQQCTHLVIDGCEVRDNCGSGLHPGSGSAGVVMKNCRLINNRSDGVFYCLRVSFTLLENCEITGNDQDGVSIGARDTEHIIRKNKVSDNGRYGIYFRKADEVMGGNRNLIETNIISENCRKSGKSEILIENINCDIWLRGNRIRCRRNSGYGIVAGRLCKRICVSDDNLFERCAGRTLPDIKNKIFRNQIPEKISAGPEHLDRHAVRHLNIEEP